jgi:hypothetical protein
MTFGNGLLRINAVWWGFMAAGGLLSLVLGAVQQNGEAAALGATAMAGALIAYAVFRWIIRGFFPAAR